MKISIAVILLLLAGNVSASSTSVTSSSTSVNNSTSITTNTNSSSNVSSNTSTSISTSAGTGAGGTNYCSTSGTQQHCEISCRRPKVARCIEGTADKPASCTCQQPRKKRKRK